MTFKFNIRRTRHHLVVLFKSILYSWRRDGRTSFNYGVGYITNGGDIIYCIDGFYHREDGPAIIDNRAIWFFKCGVQHNINGPAVIYTNGDKEYWINDKKYTEESWKERTNAF